MSDHDFEKQVQNRLDQLKLRPSGAVWAAVEKNIRKEKRRRRMILWLPIALLMLGAGGWLMLKQDQQPDSHAMTTQPASSNTTPSANNSTPHNTISSAQADKTSANNEVAKANNQVVPDNKTTAPAAKTMTGTAEAAESTTTATIPADKATRGATPARNATIVTTPAARAITGTNPVEKVSSEKAGTEKIATAKTGKTNKPVLTAKKPAVSTGKPVVASITETPAGRKLKPSVNRKPTGKEIAASGKSNSRDNNDLAAEATIPAIPPGIDSGNDNRTGIQAGDSTQPVQQDLAVQPAPAKDTATAAPALTTPAIAALTKPKKNKPTAGSKWQFGVLAEGGYSGVTEDGLFGFLENKTKVADVTMDVNSSGQVQNFAPQFPRPVYKPSAITMGPTWSIGGFAQYAFTKRIKVSAGLQYSYFSSRTVVGTKVNSARMVNLSASAASMVAYYYDANNTVDYTNKYHFIELPVTFHWQLNKGRYLPLVWDFGFAANYMLSTTALHFDGRSGVYYKDNTFFNRMQWSASTGFNVGIFPQSKHPVLIGPMLKYNLTGLLQKEHYTGQHLWAIGLRASVLLKK